MILLYQTNDVRQQRILLGAIKVNLDGHVTQSLGLRNVEDWSTIEEKLIAKFKLQALNCKLLQTFRETHYKGNLRAFREKATSNLDFEISPVR